MTGGCPPSGSRRRRRGASEVARGRPRGRRPEYVLTNFPGLVVSRRGLPPRKEPRSHGEAAMNRRNVSSPGAMRAGVSARGRVRAALLGLPFVIALLLGPAAAQPEPKTKAPATYPALPSEIPAEFKPTNAGFDHTRREAMIPMRDGVKLHTVILVPKGAKSAPILMTRTPYDANALTTHIPSAHLGPSLYGYDNATDVIVEGGFIRVVQDIRGKYGSER